MFVIAICLAAHAKATHDEAKSLGARIAESQEKEREQLLKPAK